MRCSRALKLVSPRMDGALSASRAMKLELHLAQCSSCRGVADGFELAWRRLADVGVPSPVAPDDWTAIEAAAGAPRPGWLSGWFDLGFGPTPVATAAVLLVMTLVGGVGGTLVGRAMSSSQTVPLETQLIAETLADLPWSSPASGLDPVVRHGSAAAEGRP